MTETKVDGFASVVAVATESCFSLDAFASEVIKTLANTYTHYELVVVDNGAPAAQIGALRKLMKDVPCIRVLRLSKVFPYDSAVFAGIENAIGDYVAIIQPGEDPIDEIPQLFAPIVSGEFDVVQGIAKEASEIPGFSRLTRRMFYWYNRKYLSIDIPENATYFTGFSRRAVNSLTKSGRTYKYLRHLMRYIGYPIHEYDYRMSNAKGKRRNMTKDLTQAVEMVTSYSLHPLRFVSILGLVVAVLNLFYGVYVLLVRLVSDGVVAGWASSSLQNSVMYFFLFGSLAVIAEYLGRVLHESQNEPSYFVAEEFTSTAFSPENFTKNLSS